MLCDLYSSWELDIISCADTYQSTPKSLCDFHDSNLGTDDLNVEISLVTQVKLQRRVVQYLVHVCL